MRKTICWTAIAAALCLTAVAQAQEAGERHETMAAEHHHQAADPEAGAPAAEAPAESPLEQAILGTFDAEAEKLVSLAEAFPADKYPWRPADGVRSVSEAFMHVAGGNFFISTALGAAMPEGVGPEMEKATGKDEVIAALKASIAHARGAIANTGPADMGTEVQIFGQTMTKAQVVMVLVGHTEEHLGQEIAYARMNGVVPPWSRPEPPAAKAEQGGSGR